MRIESKMTLLGVTCVFKGVPDWSGGVSFTSLGYNFLEVLPVEGGMRQGVLKNPCVH
jgi:hypothetical protein